MASMVDSMTVDASTGSELVEIEVKVSESQDAEISVLDRGTDRLIGLKLNSFETRMLIDSLQRALARQQANGSR